MKIELDRINDQSKLEGVNHKGAKVVIDGSSTENDENPGISPMELVLMGVGGCSSMDILSILKKQKQEVESYKVLVDSKRSEEIPKVFEQIHVKYIFKGNIDNIIGYVHSFDLFSFWMGQVYLMNQSLMVDH